MSYQIPGKPTIVIEIVLNALFEKKGCNARQGQKTVEYMAIHRWSSVSYGIYIIGCHPDSTPGFKNQILLVDKELGIFIFIFLSKTLTQHSKTLVGQLCTSIYSDRLMEKSNQIYNIIYFSVCRFHIFMHLNSFLSKDFVIFYNHSQSVFNF